jgi:hypothetical protein
MTAKVGIVEGEETAISKQRHGEHVSVATDGDTTNEDAVFVMWSFVATAL